MNSVLWGAIDAPGWVMIIGAIGSLVSAVLAGLATVYAAKAQALSHETKQAVAVVEEKVEVVHKATNSIVKDIGDAREEIGKYKEQSAERARVYAGSVVGSQSKSVLERIDDIPEETAEKVIEKLEE